MTQSLAKMVFLRRRKTKTSIASNTQKSSIILLDEATSSPDAETENKIQKAISFLTEEKQQLSLLELSTILNSDKIYVIDNQVVGEGKHDDY